MARAETQTHLDPIFAILLAILIVFSLRYPYIIIQLRYSRKYLSYFCSSFRGLAHFTYLSSYFEEIYELVVVDVLLGVDIQYIYGSLRSFFAG